MLSKMTKCVLSQKDQITQVKNERLKSSSYLVFYVTHLQFGGQQKTL